VLKSRSTSQALPISYEERPYPLLAVSVYGGLGFILLMLLVLTR